MEFIDNFLLNCLSFPRVIKGKNKIGEAKHKVIERPYIEIGTRL